MYLAVNSSDRICCHIHRFSFQYCGKGRPRSDTHTALGTSLLHTYCTGYQSVTHVLHWLPVCDTCPAQGYQELPRAIMIRSYLAKHVLHRFRACDTCPGLITGTSLCQHMWRKCCTGYKLRDTLCATCPARATSLCHMTSHVIHTRALVTSL
jgi:hypothetical protein